MFDFSCWLNASDARPMSPANSASQNASACWRTVSTSIESVVEDERDHEVDLVLGDPVARDLDTLILEPRRLDVAKGLRGAGHAPLDGVLEALRRGGADLGDTGDGHGWSSWCGTPVSGRGRDGFDAAHTPDLADKSQLRGSE